jgi:hypothetical protein
MIEISDEFHTSTGGNYFTSYKKNLGNKLFIYSCSRLLSDILDYDLICPEKALIRRENQITNQYEDIYFPFGSVHGRTQVKNPIFVVNDEDIVSCGSLENLIKRYPNHGFFIQTYFSKYDYIKPYKDKVKEYFKSLVLPNRNDNDLVIMLRNSTMAGNFMLPDKYYLDILETETFDNLYISLDHKFKHVNLLKKLEKYNPIFIEGDILHVFSQVTSFNKIVAAQGTFSFWACFLSNAEKIYWPNTNDGPNSNNPTWEKYMNLKIDDEERFHHVYVDNIYDYE